MLKIYPEDTIWTRQRNTNTIYCTGLGVAVVLVIVGALQGTVFPIRMGIGVALVTMGVLTAYGYYLTGGFERSAGNVLEVRDDVVVRHYASPFVYKVKDLEGGSLVAFDFGKQITITKTLRIPVQGGIFSYSLSCVAMVNSFQPFYNAFLQPKKRGVIEPETVMHASVATFLHQQRQRIADLQSGEGVLDTHRDAYVIAGTCDMAREYLRKELEGCGLMLCEIIPECSLRPSIIE